MKMQKALLITTILANIATFGTFIFLIVDHYRKDMQKEPAVLNPVVYPTTYLKNTKIDNHCFKTY